MSELAAKLAIRRSKIASPAEAARIAADIGAASSSENTATLATTPNQKQSTSLPADNVRDGHDRTPETAMNPSPDSAPWRETPSQKMHPVRSSPSPDISHAKSVEKGVGPVEKDSSVGDRDHDGFDNIDDFLGAGLNEGLDKLNIRSDQTHAKGGIRRRNSTTRNDNEDEKVSEVYGDGELGQLRSQIELLQAENKEKDELINALQSEVSRLSKDTDRDSSMQDESDSGLHPLRESETDPFGSHMGTRRGSTYTKSRPRGLTRSRINSWADEERKRSSSASVLAFDSPEKMKDMFHLLLEDSEGSAGSSGKMGSGVKEWFDMNDNEEISAKFRSEEALFGSVNGNRDIYDPDRISLGSFSLSEASKEGTKAIPKGADSSDSISRAKQIKKIYEDSELFAEEGSVFKNVESPLPPGPDGNSEGVRPKAKSSAGLFSRSESGDGEDSLRFRENGTKELRTKGENEMGYMDFMNRLCEPESEDMALVIKKFLLSVMGPKGDGTAPSIFQDKEIDYTFYGTADLDKRISDFYKAMDGHFRAHPAWQGFCDEKYVCILDCLERHVLSMIHDLAYDSVVPATMDEDEELKRQLEILQFLPAEALDIPVDLQNDVVWAVASNELRKINSYRTPGEKIGCIVACSALITRFLGAAKLKAGEGGDPGADEFLPLFIWVVLKAKCPFLYRNTEYISIFHHPTRLMGMSGYCLMNLRSALEFLRELKTADNISMDKAEFSRLYDAAADRIDAISDQ